MQQNMYPKSRFRTHIGRNVYPLGHFLALIASALLLAGCSPKVVTVDRWHERQTVRTERDSIFYSDTVRIQGRGDTVFVEVTKWRTRTLTRSDTLRLTDTVQVEGQGIEALMQERSSLQSDLYKSERERIKAVIWAIALPALLLLLCAAVIYFIRKHDR